MNILIIIVLIVDMIIRYDYVEFFRNYGGDRNAVYERHSCFRFMNSCWQAEILISSKFSVWSKYMKKEENTPNADSNGLKLHKIKNP